MSDRYIVVRRDAPSVPLAGSHDIAAAIFARLRMVLADRSLRAVLVVLETPPRGETWAPRQVYPRVAEGAAS